LICRDESRESIIIADLTTGDSLFNIVKSFTLPVPTDLVKLVWSADDSSLIAVGSPVHSDLIQLSIATGQIDGTALVGSRELGARIVCDNPQTLIIGGFDQSVRIFSKSSNLTLLAEIPLTENTIPIIRDSPAVFRESLGDSASQRDRNTYDYGGPNQSASPPEYREVLPTSGAVQLPSIDAVITQAHLTGRRLEMNGAPRAGVSALELSPSGSWLAVQTDEKASLIFLIDLVGLKVGQVLIHRQPVRSFHWDPCQTRDQLVISTGDERVFIWSTDLQQSTIELKDSSTKLIDAVWVQNGGYVMISDQTRICCVNFEMKSEPLGG
jgi:WD40 repeat protein